MHQKSFPLTLEETKKIKETFGTPFYLYDEKAIIENVHRLQKTFSWAKGFKEYFAVKATPNPSLLALFKKEGLGADCSSLPELLLAESVGITGEDIMFSSNNTPMEEYEKAMELGAILNLDDISHIDFIAQKHPLPKTLSFRYNPGPLREGNEIIGKPEEAKYGLTKEQLFEAYQKAKDLGVEHFGLHTMIASNEINLDYFAETADMMFSLAAELFAQGIQIEFIDLGGGIGIPYKPEDDPMDLEALGERVHALYEQYIVQNNVPDIKIFLECGRVITGPYGYLVTSAIHYKNTYRNYIGVDACMANLMRPGMYGSYHHITVLGKENTESDHVYDVVGSLCENNDKFAVQRNLPAIDMDDILIIHDAGAHGHAMGFNYNGKLRCQELLLTSNKEVKMIRRNETIEDLFATLHQLSDKTIQL